MHVVATTYAYVCIMCGVLCRMCCAVVSCRFFSNYLNTSIIPVISKVSSNDFFQTSDLACNPTTLTSKDTDFVMATNDDSEDTCVADGLARFTRTWSDEDKCGNVRTLVQSITIEHPPAGIGPYTWEQEDDLTSGARAWREAGPESQQLSLPSTYSIVTDVQQHKDPCFPGKALALGEITYTPAGDYDQCTATLFKEDGCRVSARGINPIVNLSALAPRFESFPQDVEITTEDNHLPKATGEPKGVAFCHTPFEVYYNDSNPVQQNPHGCQWVIERTWTIRPVYVSNMGDGLRLKLDSTLRNFVWMNLIWR
jgi:hypothetical protein